MDPRVAINQLLDGLTAGGEDGENDAQDALDTLMTWRRGGGYIPTARF